MAGGRVRVEPVTADTGHVREAENDLGDEKEIVIEF